MVTRQIAEAPKRRNREARLFEPRSGGCCGVSKFRRSGVCRGVALMEAIVGGALLGIGLAVLLAISSQSISQQRLGEERIVAAALLDELLNEVLMEGPLDYQAAYDLAGQFDSPFQNYTYRIDLQNLGDIEPYRVTATVYWVSNGIERSETIETLIAQPRGENLEEIRIPGVPIDR